MDKRMQIGFYYYFDKSWLGGMYYAQNLIMALNTLPDSKKPIINVYCYDHQTFEELCNNTGYPYLKQTIVKISRVKQLWRLLLSPISSRIASTVDLFPIDSRDLLVFPYGWGKHVDKLLYWMPDFQYKHFPQFFTKRDLLKRDFALTSVCERRVPIVFSSYNSQEDFKKFYPKFANNKTYVVHFAVNQPDYSNINFEDLKNKHDIVGNYLLCSNQFWQHKNHLFLFRSFKAALDHGLKMQLVCTGRLADDRNPEYINTIKQFISDNSLEHHIKLLGIIDKLDMLCLMKNSYAVIQPSLFEGWNTTVEDCKKMNKFIFLSDLKVHREQITDNVCFFDPLNESDLTNKLLTITPEISEHNYAKNVEAFANDFLDIIYDYAR